MAPNSTWGVTPRESIERECARRGRASVVIGCRALLRGNQADPDLLLALGGPAAHAFLDDPDRADAYWPRVWGARGLLWAWDESATQDIGTALSDEAWRVREMAIKVIARHQIGGLVSDVAQLRSDDVARVRLAADRALAVLTSGQA
ncbi:MAG: HEAT repeat domain-containing protein [Actinobacteria bacterium]|nr:HEAT repeat domain-containing protein [Actinomycetota bacterium]